MMIRPIALALACLAAALTVGCGGLAPGPMLPAPNHGGAMAQLSGGRGLVEVATRGEGQGGRSRRLRIVAYFYREDGTSAMPEAPTEVTVKLGTSATSPVVPLLVDPKLDGEEGGQKYASQAGPYPPGFEGKLQARLGGEPVEASFLIR